MSFGLKTRKLTPHLVLLWLLCPDRFLPSRSLGLLKDKRGNNKIEAEINDIEGENEDDEQNQKPIKIKLINESGKTHPEKEKMQIKYRTKIDQKF